MSMYNELPELSVNGPAMQHVGNGNNVTLLPSSLEPDLDDGSRLAPFTRSWFKEMFTPTKQNPEECGTSAKPLPAVAPSQEGLSEIDANAEQWANDQARDFRSACEGNVVGEAIPATNNLVGGMDVGFVAATSLLALSAGDGQVHEHTSVEAALPLTGAEHPEGQAAGAAEMLRQHELASATIPAGDGQEVQVLPSGTQRPAAAGARRSRESLKRRLLDGGQSSRSVRRTTARRMDGATGALNSPEDLSEGDNYMVAGEPGNP